MEPSSPEVPKRVQKSIKNDHLDRSLSLEGAAVARRAPSNIPIFIARLQRYPGPVGPGPPWAPLRTEAPRVTPGGRLDLRNSNFAPTSPANPLDGRTLFTKQGSRPFFQGIPPNSCVYAPKIASLIKNQNVSTSYHTFDPMHPSSIVAGGTLIADSDSCPFFMGRTSKTGSYLPEVTSVMASAPPTIHPTSSDHAKTFQREASKKPFSEQGSRPNFQGPSQKTASLININASATLPTVLHYMKHPNPQIYSNPEVKGRLREKIVYLPRIPVNSPTNSAAGDTEGFSISSSRSSCYASSVPRLISHLSVAKKAPLQENIPLSHNSSSTYRTLVPLQSMHEIYHPSLPPPGLHQAPLGSTLSHKENIPPHIYETPSLSHKVTQNPDSQAPTEPATMYANVDDLRGLEHNRDSLDHQIHPEEDQLNKQTLVQPQVFNIQNPAPYNIISNNRFWTAQGRVSQIVGPDRERQGSHNGDKDGITPSEPPLTSGMLDQMVISENSANNSGHMPASARCRHVSSLFPSEPSGETLGSRDTSSDHPQSLNETKYENLSEILDPTYIPSRYTSPRPCRPERLLKNPENSCRQLRLKVTPPFKECGSKPLNVNRQGESKLVKQQIGESQYTNICELERNENVRRSNLFEGLSIQEMTHLRQELDWKLHNKEHCEHTPVRTYKEECPMYASERTHAVYRPREDQHSNPRDCPRTSSVTFETLLKPFQEDAKIQLTPEEMPNPQGQSSAHQEYHDSTVPLKLNMCRNIEKYRVGVRGTFAAWSETLARCMSYDKITLDEHRNHVLHLYLSQEEAQAASNIILHTTNLLPS